jgi:predicted MFS family arabinose efflux permease
MTALTQAKAKTAQRALIVMFFVQGFSATTFVPRIPELIAQLHVNFVIWGSVIGLSGLGSLLPLIFTNQLVARCGTRPVIRVAAAFISLFVVLIPWSTNIWVFFAMQAMQTMAFSAYNIAINAASVMLQKKMKRTIVGTMHAGWSIGAAISAAISGVLVDLLEFKLNMALTGLVCFLAFQFAGRALLEPAEDGHKSEVARQQKVSWLKTPTFVWVLTAGLFAGVWPEVVMIDWSALFSKSVMQLGPALSAVPYTVFTIAMIIGRLSINRFTKRLHISEMAKWGGVIGSLLIFAGIFIGPLLAKTDSTLGLVVLCLLWGIAGLGVGPQVPSVFTAGGNVMGLTTAQALSRMSMINMFLMLGAKFFMGALAQQDLQAAFLFPATTLMIAGIIAAFVVKRAKSNENDMLTAFPPTSPIVVIED